MTGNNPNQVLVNINARIKFAEILSICSQDNEPKQNYDKHNDGWNKGQPKSSIACFFKA